MLQYHKSLLEDKLRVDQYKRAIFSVVKPGDVVIDVGAGTGILSFLACEAGAKKVIAIESSGIIEVAKQIANDNRFYEKIVFINKNSDNFEMNEKVDVIISEMLGASGFDEGTTRLISDIKTRFLKQNGRTIPKTLTLFLAPIYDPKLYKDVDFWDKKISGVSCKSVKQFAVNQTYNIIADENLNKNSSQVYTYDFSKDYHENIAFDLKFDALANSTLYGFLGWFECELADGIKLTNEPGTKTHWDQTFFPLENPVKLNGEKVTVNFDGFYLGKRFYWSWKTAVLNSKEKIKAQFSQNNIDEHYAKKILEKAK